MADDDADALTKCRDSAFDMIAMDLQMPVMDGFQALARLKAQGITTPVIAITAHAMKEDVEKCYKAGFHGYLAKPVSNNSLMASVLPFLKNR